MKRFKVLQPRGQMTDASVVDTLRYHRLVVTCLTADSAERLADVLNTLRPRWWTCAGPYNSVKILAEVDLPGGRVAASQWSVHRREVKDMSMGRFLSIISIAEDMLHGAAAKHCADR